MEWRPWKSPTIYFFEKWKAGKIALNSLEEVERLTVKVLQALTVVELPRHRLWAAMFYVQSAEVNKNPPWNHVYLADLLMLQWNHR